MKHVYRLVVALVAFSALMLAGCGGSSSTTTGGNGTTAPTASIGAAQHYTVALQSLNNSGVTGTASFTLTGNQLSVHITATGLVASQPHAQHIHGGPAKPATCPTSAAADASGLITLQGGVPFYGPVALGLQTVTADGTGAVDYTQNFSLTDNEKTAVTPLNNRVVVLHGLNHAGAYDPTLPVACGAVQTA